MQEIYIKETKVIDAKGNVILKVVFGIGGFLGIFKGEELRKGPKKGTQMRFQQINLQFSEPMMDTLCG